MTFPVEFRVVGQAVLDAAPDDGLRDDLTVRFRDQAPVNRAWSVVGRSPVVFGGLGDGLDLFLGEPIAQTLVGTDDVS